MQMAETQRFASSALEPVQDDWEDPRKLVEDYEGYPVLEVALVFMASYALTKVLRRVVSR
jgi:hypothetical protein